MFEGCISLNEIIFPFAIIDSIKNTSRMFFGCSNLKSINLQDLSAMINCMDYMFYGCINLIYLDISNLYTKNEPDCFKIFEGVPKNINIIIDRGKLGVRIKKEIEKLSLE